MDEQITSKLVLFLLSYSIFSNKTATFLSWNIKLEETSLTSLYDEIGLKSRDFMELIPGLITDVIKT